MGFAYTDDEGAYLVRLARKSLSTRLATGEPLHLPADVPPRLREASGIFVTLRRHAAPHDESLRGCIGMIEAREPIALGAIHMAVSAGLNDPRFPPVKASELDRLVFEVTAMTPPVLLAAKDPDAIRASIVLGRDGLIMQKGYQRGLLLPQVPVEQDPPWDVEMFLDWTCKKAFLPNGAWKDPTTKILTFQGEIFEETEPNGPVVRKVI